MKQSILAISAIKFIAPIELFLSADFFSSSFFCCIALFLGIKKLRSVFENMLLLALPRVFYCFIINKIVIRCQNL